LRAPPKNSSKKEKSILLGSALNEQAGGAGLFFYSLGRGGIPPTPPFRRALASTTGRAIAERVYPFLFSIALAVISMLQL